MKTTYWIGKASLEGYFAEARIAREWVERAEKEDGFMSYKVVVNFVSTQRKGTTKTEDMSRLAGFTFTEEYEKTLSISEMKTILIARIAGDLAYNQIKQYQDSSLSGAGLAVTVEASYQAFSAIVAAIMNAKEDKEQF